MKGRALLAWNLRALRTARSLSQERLAADAGVDRAWVSELEREQGNTSVDIDGLLVSGGGYAFRLGMPGPVRNLKIVDRSWGYGPIDVKCSAVTAWDAKIVTLGANGQPTDVRTQPCNTETGN